ncbi:MAG TPA: hypothetical protein VL481_02815 [Verrucomicrobiae bacterium]|nr:hypothetical protein [Verrucomicrobiae bacterium]
MSEKLTATWHWLRDEKRIIWFEYSALALAVLLPLLLPGFILTLDMVFTPHIGFPTDVSNTYPLQLLLWLLHFILPADVIQKIILFAILLFSGVGMHSLLQSLNMKERIGADLWRLGLYFGGIFYMINPFTYSRFMAGQWLFLLGYAMVPFFIKSLLKFFTLPSLQTVVPLAAWSFAIVTASIHHIAILFIIALLLPLLAWGFHYFRKSRAKQYFIWSGVLLAALAVLCSYWLIPALMGNGSIGEVVTSRGSADFSAFATGGGSLLGVIGEVVRLQGFWAESRQLFTLPQDIVPAWGVLFLIIWILVITGASKAWNASRLLVTLAVTCIVLGVILAATPLVAWVSQILPLVSGYREPDKFANLIALGYAMLGTLGAAFTAKWATEKFHDIGGQVVIMICLLLPIAVTPAMLWGFGGQLSPKQYPAGWTAMDNKLVSLPGAKRVLFLPWHQYMAFKFSDRIIATPAEKFFTVPTVASDDPEFGSVTPTMPNKEKEDIKTALGHLETLVPTLASHHITYILLAKDDDASSYDYINHQAGIKLIDENDSLKLYEVTP